MPPRDAPKAQPANTWVFVLALGLLIGFVIGFVLLLSRLPVDPGLVSLRTSELVETRDAAGDYDFYTVLADREVTRPTRLRAEETTPVVARTRETLRSSVVPATRVVPGTAQRVVPDDVAGARYREIPASSAGQESYYLQAGNFPDPGEAERARAVLLLLGLDAFVVPRQESDGSTGHRVRVGPFFDAERLSAARRKLRDGGIDYDLIRVTG